MFKRVISRFLLSIFLFCGVVWIYPTANVACAHASNPVAIPTISSTIENAKTAIIERGEQTEWVYRVIDGKLQKRLWPITYGKWLTDWEWV